MGVDVSYERGTPVTRWRAESVGGHQAAQACAPRPGKEAILYEMCFNLKYFWKCSLLHDFLDITSKDHSV